MKTFTLKNLKQNTTRSNQAKEKKKEGAGAFIPHLIPISPPHNWSYNDRIWSALCTRPPPVSPSERRLLRSQRTTLSQLRSGHCRLMLDYRVRVGQATSDVCPACNSQPHTVPHLFDCAAAPTALTIRDLWLNPVAVCDFLSSLPTFSSLQSPVTPPPPSPPPPPPPLPPPSPRPPPEPPP